MVPHNDNTESIWLRQSSDNTELKLGFFYCSPENNNSCIAETINSEINRFGNDKNTYIFGDFNARTKTEIESVTYDKYDEELGVPTCIHAPPPARNSEDMKIVNKRGKDFLDICRTNDLVIANGRTVGDIFGKYTCHQKTGSSVVDYLITPYKAIMNVQKFCIGEYIPTLSDHCSLQANLSIPAKLTKEKHIEVELQDLPKRYIWNRDDDETFKAKLASDPFKEKITTLMAADDNPNLAQDIRNLLVDAADQCKIRKTSRRQREDKPWFDDECRKLKNSIKSTGREVKWNPQDVESREKLYIEKKQLRNLIKKNKYTYRKSIVDKMCENLSKGEKKQYWKLLKKLEEPQDTNRYMHEQKLIDHFKDILTDPNGASDAIDAEENDNSDETLNCTINKEELEAAAKVLRYGKSPGLDRVLNEMILPLVNLYPGLLLKLFNSVLTNTWVTNEWLMSLITALHKKGNKEDPDNYRGISLMSCMAKLFLTILNNRIANFAKERKILTPSQLGFVFGNRTSDPHIILNNILQKYCHNKNKKIFGCFVDFSKAFDSVPRDILLTKLKKHDINGKVFDIIKTIYTKDEACVKFGDKFSLPFRTTRGVRQGCVLSPLLFNIFLADIQPIFDKCGSNPELNGQEMSCLIWADDILILSETEEGFYYYYYYYSTNPLENIQVD